MFLSGPYLTNTFPTHLSRDCKTFSWVGSPAASRVGESLRPARPKYPRKVVPSSSFLCRRPCALLRLLAPEGKLRKNKRRLSVYLLSFSLFLSTSLSLSLSLSHTPSLSFRMFESFPSFSFHLFVCSPSPIAFSLSNFLLYSLFLFFIYILLTLGFKLSRGSFGSS